MHQEPILQIENLSVSFGGLAAVQDLSLSISSGTIHALIGPNGAGKSTVFNVITRLVSPDRGRIMFNGIEVLKVPPHDVARMGITRTFQNVESFATMSVEENLLVGHHFRFRAGWLATAFGLPSARRAEAVGRARVKEVIDLLGLTGVVDRPIASLPLALQKRVELARALVAGPQLLLLDEPAAGLNEAETLQMSALLRGICRDGGVTILLVEHDMSLVMLISDRVTVISFGKFVAEGTPSEVQSSPAVQRAYLGRKAVEGRA